MIKSQLLELFPMGESFPHSPTAKYDPLTAITSGISMGGSLLGGIFGSSASKKAGEIQSQNAQHVADITGQAVQGAQKGEGESVGIANDYLNQAGFNLKDLFGGQTNNLNPYLQAGAQGANTLQQLMQPGGELTDKFSFDPSQIASSPEYQFALKQGTDAVNASQSAKGLLNSGSTLKGLMDYGQGLASQQYQNAYGNALNTFQTNHNNTLQGLMALTGLGEFGTQQYNQASQNFGSGTTNIAQLMGGNTLHASEYGGDVGLHGAQMIGDALTGGANAKAAGTVGSANAWSNALSGVGNAAMGGATSYNLRNIMTGGGGVAPAYSGPSAADYARKLWTTPMAEPPVPSGGYGVVPTSPWSNLNIGALMQPQG